MKRAVPDTNILISALLFGGLPARWLELASMRAFQALTSAALLDEFEDALRRKFGRPAAETEAIRLRLEAILETVSPHRSIRAIKNDPDDDRVLECAVAGRADYIISEDHHLRDLGQFKGIRIVSLREFMNLLRPPN